MELDKLIIEISADSAEFVRALNQNSKVLKDFGITGTATADQLTKALASIARESKKATDPEQVRVLSAVYNELSSKLKILNTNIANYARQVDESGNVTEGFGKKTKKGVDALNDADEASRRARIAVYGLNQVVRDLPFGFIAISNNIPVLIDQFQELVKTKGNTRAAFKEFAAGLIGAGGVSVAISAVISLITTAVQKYGSLSNAVTALTTDLGPLIERLNEANKSYEGFLKQSLTLPEVRTTSAISSDAEVARLDNLIRGLRDENKTRAEKEAILKRIQQLDSGLFQGYDVQVDQLDNVITALELYKTSLRNTTAEKNYTKQLADTVDELSKQQLELDNLNARVAQADSEFNKLNNRLSKLQVNAPGYELLSERVNKAATSVKQLTALQTEQRNRVQALIIQQSEYGTAVDNSANKQITAISKVNEFIQANFKKTANAQSKSTNDAFTARLNVLRAELEAQKSQLSNLNELSSEYVNIKISIANKEFEIASLLAKKQIKNQKELNNAILFLQQELEAKKANIINSAAAARFAAADAELEQRKKVVQAELDFIESTTNEVLGKPDIINKRISDSFRKLGEDLKAQEEQQKKLLENYQAFAEGVANTIANIGGDLVQGILDGKSAVDVLRNSLKGLIADFAAAATKAIALRAIQSAFGVAAQAGAAAFNPLSLLSLGFLGAGARAEAGFGGLRTEGVVQGAGGIALSGNVTFIQRGTDLVGVLNRTNNRIGRVG